MQNLELFKKDSIELHKQFHSQATKNLQKVQKYARKCFEANRQKCYCFRQIECAKNRMIWLIEN